MKAEGEPPRRQKREDEGGRKGLTRRRGEHGEEFVGKGISHSRHKKKKRQEKRKFVGLEWHATLSAMRTCVRVLKNLANLVHLCGQPHFPVPNPCSYWFLPLPLTGTEF